MSFADLFVPTRRVAVPSRPPMWQTPVTRPETPEAIRARAYDIARKELPDAPVEDVICRAEKIAAYLASAPST